MEFNHSCVVPVPSQLQNNVQNVRMQPAGGQHMMMPGPMQNWNQSQMMMLTMTGQVQNWNQAQTMPMMTVMAPGQVQNWNQAQMMPMMMRMAPGHEQNWYLSQMMPMPVMQGGMQMQNQDSLQTQNGVQMQNGTQNGMQTGSQNGNNRKCGINIHRPMQPEPSSGDGMTPRTRESYEIMKAKEDSRQEWDWEQLNSAIKASEADRDQLNQAAARSSVNRCKPVKDSPFSPDVDLNDHVEAICGLQGHFDRQQFANSTENSMQIFSAKVPSGRDGVEIRDLQDEFGIYPMAIQEPVPGPASFGHLHLDVCDGIKLKGGYILWFAFGGQIEPRKDNVEVTIANALQGREEFQGTFDKNELVGSLRQIFATHAKLPLDSISFVNTATTPTILEDQVPIRDISSKEPVNDPVELDPKAQKLAESDQKVQKVFSVSTQMPPDMMPKELLGLDGLRKFLYLTTSDELLNHCQVGYMPLRRWPLPAAWEGRTPRWLQNEHGITLCCTKRYLGGDICLDGNAAFKQRDTLFLNWTNSKKFIEKKFHLEKKV